jgi:hypothetical protein
VAQVLKSEWESLQNGSNNVRINARDHIFPRAHCGGVEELENPRDLNTRTRRMPRATIHRSIKDTAEQKDQNRRTMDESWQ